MPLARMCDLCDYITLGFEIHGSAAVMFNGQKDTKNSVNQDHVGLDKISKIVPIVPITGIACFKSAYRIGHYGPNWKNLKV